MASEESDDEPLAVFAAAKKQDPHKYVDITPVPKVVQKRSSTKMKKTKKGRSSKLKKLPLSFKIERMFPRKTAQQVVEKPEDVWLYLKDLNPTGPYSCLLCSEWFINRAKIVIHYILNHKKDFCGICRYFLADRASWLVHQTFHTPWPCSQCDETFPNENELRVHFSNIHTLVHCRLCQFLVPDNDQYSTHLIEKHSVTSVSNKNVEPLWDVDSEDNHRFHCLLCSKSGILLSTFTNHYITTHRFSLICFANMISGTDPLISIHGCDVSPDFMESLKGFPKYGYVDLDKQLTLPENEMAVDNIVGNDFLDIEVKLEETSDTEAKNESYNNQEENTDNNHFEVIKDYKGEEDFDVTLTELVIIEKCYFDYLLQTHSDINANNVPIDSNIVYGKEKEPSGVDCSLCSSRFDNMQAFVTHMKDMHRVKTIPLFWCRVCATTFDTQNELDAHTTEELGEFDDLWICQFCDKEFDNRKQTRDHLTNHLESLQVDNCFSPHLGFKCKYCPTLFWNETDRETHHVKIHFNERKKDYYKCETCEEIFSDKVFFTYHHIAKHEGSKDLHQYLLKCTLCCVVIPSVEEMRIHFQADHPEARKVFCSLDACQFKPLSHKKSFQLHLRSQHSKVAPKDAMYACLYCPRQFPTNRAKSAHMAASHTSQGKFKCFMCEEMLHSVDERKLHFLIRHPGHHPYRCKDCGKSFQYKSSLYIHKKEHYPDTQSFTCNYCQKVFRKKDSWREHLQIHEGPRHACSYCPMRFVQRSNMLRHERRHTGERPYSCPHCDRTFADKGACTSHTRTHTSMESYTCMFCGKRFAQKAKLKYHVRTHTGEDLETCPVCSKTFTNTGSLKDHMKIHVDLKDREVTCPLCERKYRDERYMLRHLRECHTRGTYTCPLCSKQLNSSEGLRYHVITHSTVNAFRCKCCTSTFAVKKTMARHLRKRHSIKGSVLKDYYDKLNPRQLNIGLDEPTMTAIFGPPKTRLADIILSDVINNLATTSKVDDGDESGEVGSNGSKSDEEMGSGHELEPTDFVSIKIEPMDEGEYEG